MEIEGEDNRVDIAVFEVGVTPIGTLAPLQDFVAYLDTGNGVAYTTAEDAERVRDLLRAEASEHGWTIRREGFEATYRVEDLETLDPEQPVQLADGAVLKNWRCEALPPNTCQNIFHTATGAFVYSIKVPPDGLAVCRPRDDEECAYFVRAFMVNVFPQKNCAGPAQRRQVNWTLCHMT